METNTGHDIVVVFYRPRDRLLAFTPTSSYSYSIIKTLETTRYKCVTFFIMRKEKGCEVTMQKWAEDDLRLCKV